MTRTQWSGSKTNDAYLMAQGLCALKQVQPRKIMANKRFTAKKVGDQYVLVPQGTQQELSRGACGVASTLAIVLGLKRGGMLGMLFTVAGMGGVYHALTGRSPIGFLGARPGGRHGDPSQSPSHQNDWKETGQLPADAVDEAAMESFPASDPPAPRASV